MGYTDQSPAFLSHLENLRSALGLKGAVANRQNLIDDEQPAVCMYGDRKGESQNHSGRVRAQRLVDELSYLGELDDRTDHILRLLPVQPEERRVQPDILPPSQVGVKSRAQL